MAVAAWETRLPNKINRVAAQRFERGLLAGVMGGAARHDARRADGEAARAMHCGAAGVGRQCMLDNFECPSAETLALARLYLDGIGSLRLGPRPSLT